MEQIEMWVLVALLIAIVIVQEILHKQEREDLYNRIMARDLTEFKADGKHRSVPNGIRKRAAEEQDRRNSPE